MESEVLSLLCDPDTRYEFELEGSSLRNTATGRVYPIRDGIPLFVSTLTGSNLKHQAFYDRIAPGYDFAQALSRWLGSKQTYRREIVSELKIAPKARVLEVGVGTGANIAYLPRDVDFFGLDLSWGMLHKCRKNLKKWDRTARLFQGEAGHLPFRAEVFDCVFHVGGINLFSEPERAMREMIWVAKPGARIVIADETEKAIKNGFLKNLVPEEVEGVHAKEIADGKFYCLSFRKPASPAR